MQPLTTSQEALHLRALELSRQHRRLESHLLEVLQQVEKMGLHKKMGKPSLFAYAVETLNLSESVAYCFISVARKAVQVPALQVAVASQKISVNKASRIVSCLTDTNAEELIEFASLHSSKAVDAEVARRNPRAISRDRVKPMNEDQVQLTITVSKKTYEKLARAESLEAQRGQALSRGATLDAVLEVYLEKRDPVRKANRAKVKKPVGGDSKLCDLRVDEPRSRKPLSAAERHEVFARDQGRCTHVDASGQRCQSDRWIEIHHIRSIAAGGSNDPENLTTLCSFHHDLVHQLSLPIDGEITWLRSPHRQYRA